MTAPSGGWLQSYALGVQQPRPGVVVLAVRDELDGPAGPFRDCLNNVRRPGLRHLVIDLSAMTYIGSAGLRMLVDALPPHNGAGYRAHLAGVGAGSTTMRLLRIASLDGLFTVFDGLDECLASLDGR